jgi:hypothetical protein
MQLSCKIADEFRLENKDNKKTRKAPSIKLKIGKKSRRNTNKGSKLQKG